MIHLLGKLNVIALPPCLQQKKKKKNFGDITLIVSPLKITLSELGLEVN